MKPSDRNEDTNGTAADASAPNARGLPEVEDAIRRYSRYLRLSAANRPTDSIRVRSVEETIFRRECLAGNHALVDRIFVNLKRVYPGKGKDARKLRSAAMEGIVSMIVNRLRTVKSLDNDPVSTLVEWIDDLCFSCVGRHRKPPTRELRTKDQPDGVAGEPVHKERGWALIEPLLRLLGKDRNLVAHERIILFLRHDCGCTYQTIADILNSKREPPAAVTGDPQLSEDLRAARAELTALISRAKVSKRYNAAREKVRKALIALPYTRNELLALIRFANS